MNMGRKRYLAVQSSSAPLPSNPSIMQATNFLPCKAPLYGISPIPNRGKSFPLVRARRDLGDGDYAGRLVDDNMIVLRTRIRDLKISEEARGERTPPFSGSLWTDWEEDYQDLSCQNEGRGVIGFLHTLVMRQGPGSAMGFVAILSLLTGVTATWLVFAAMELARGLSS